MSNQNNIVLKSGMWYTISNFLLRGIGFITTPIFTRLLTQEEFGSFSNFSSWVSILTIVVTLNVEATLISARYEYEDKLDEYILSVLSLSILSTSIWWLCANVFSAQATELLDMNSTYMNAIFVYLLVVPAINLFQSRERFFYRYKMSVAISMILSVGTALFSVLLVVIMTNRLTGRIFGMVIPSLLIGFILIMYFWVKGKRIRVCYWKSAIKIVLPFIPHLLSLTILNMMDRIMITKICGERETALYSLGYTVATIITILLTSLNGAFAPWLGEKLAKKEHTEIRKVSKGYILLFTYFAVGLMLIAPEVLLILGGESYTDAKWIMIPISFGCVCQFIYTLFVNVEQFEKKTVGMAFASMSAALLNFGLNAWLIPIFGYVAASYTTLIGYLWLLLVHMYLVYRLGLGKVYSYRFIAVVVAVVAGVALLINALYTMDLLRYAVLVAYIAATLVVVMKNKEKIMKLVKR